jgi:hypothetical protein
VVRTGGSAASTPAEGIATAGAGSRHPLVVCALQGAASITEMVLPISLAV